MNDQLQCCDSCVPLWIFELKDGSIIPVCGVCATHDSLKEITKSAWNITSRKYENEILDCPPLNLMAHGNISRGGAI